MEITAKLNDALAKAQAEFTAVAFDSTNPFLKNKYASLGACIQSTKPILAKHGLSVTQEPVSDGQRIGVVTTLRHASGECSSSTLYLPLGDEKGKSQAQVAGSIITYLRRYSLTGVLGLYADEDTNGHAPTQPSTIQTPARAIPAATVTSKKERVFTAADRTKFIAAALKNNFTGEELQEYAVKANIILRTENAVNDWPLHRLPQTKEAFAALMEDIKGFVRDGDNIP